MSTIMRLLKTAEVIINSGNKNEIATFCNQFDMFLLKNSHFEPKNDGTTPEFWKKNLDYAPYENSPYYGSASEFLKKFPRGISDWLEWRRKGNKKTKARLEKIENLMKLAHYEPVGGDDVESFENEPHLYSGNGPKNYKSVEEYIEKLRGSTGQEANDAAFDAARDFVNYYSLMLKKKKKGKSKK